MLCRQRLKFTPAFIYLHKVHIDYRCNQVDRIIVSFYHPRIDQGGSIPGLYVWPVVVLYTSTGTCMYAYIYIYVYIHSLLPRQVF